MLAESISPTVRTMTRVEDVDEEEIGRRAGEKEYIDAMQYVAGCRVLSDSTGRQPTLNRTAERKTGLIRAMSALRVRDGGLDLLRRAA